MQKHNKLVAKFEKKFRAYNSQDNSIFAKELAFNENRFEDRKVY